jgi:hypothetical protein
VERRITTEPPPETKPFTDIKTSYFGFLYATIKIKKIINYLYNNITYMQPFVKTIMYIQCKKYYRQKIMPNTKNKKEISPYP